MDKKFIKLIISIVVLLFATMAFFLYFTPFITIKVLGETGEITAIDILTDITRDEDEKIYVDYETHKYGEYGLLASYCIVIVLFVSVIGMVVLDILRFLGKNQIKFQFANAVSSVIFLPILGLAVLILNCCTLKIVGYDGTPFAHIGGGAVTSGIFAVILCSLIGASNFLICEKGESTISTQSKVDKTNKDWMNQLKDVKDLYDAGILTEEEFLQEKNKIMEKKSVNLDIDGTYCFNDLKLAIRMGTFSITKANKPMISGSVIYSDNTIILNRSDGKKAIFRKHEEGLISENGIIYKRQ